MSLVARNPGPGGQPDSTGTARNAGFPMGVPVQVS
jgi:hypothetical protein